MKVLRQAYAVSTLIAAADDVARTKSGSLDEGSWRGGGSRSSRERRDRNLHGSS